MGTALAVHPRNLVRGTAIPVVVVAPLVAGVAEALVTVHVSKATALLGLIVLHNL